MDVDLVPFVNLDSDDQEEEDPDLEEEDPDPSWARIDYHATEQARYSTKQARAAQYAEDLHKAMTQLLAEQEGRERAKARARPQWRWRASVRPRWRFLPPPKMTTWTGNNCGGK